MFDSGAVCNGCHERLSFHGGNRTDSLDGCATCHNPRYTDRDKRPDTAPAGTPDGKSEETIDFKIMAHGIHASMFRTEPLVIYGFGDNANVFDEDHVQYPGRLANCLGCHVDDTFTLPLQESVLGTTVDTGSDFQDPTDDIVASPMSAVCASCHDTDVAIAHMENSGGDFSTTQAFLDNGTTVEQCATCHREGASAAVSVVHAVQPL